jgi:hypothetical protein
LDRRIVELAGEMNRETDQIRAAWAAGDRIGAMRIAARSLDRSADTKTFMRGIEQLIASALELLAPIKAGSH